MMERTIVITRVSRSPLLLHIELDTVRRRSRCLLGEHFLSKLWQFFEETLKCLVESFWLIDENAVPCVVDLDQASLR